MLALLAKRVEARPFLRRRYDVPTKGKDADLIGISTSTHDIHKPTIRLVIVPSLLGAPSSSRPAMPP